MSGWLLEPRRQVDMIAPDLVAEIKRLLVEERLSQRKVATRTGVSRNTVQAIACGRRPDYALRADPDNEFPVPAGPVRRCPTCGGMVSMPCLACHVLALRRHRKRFPDCAPPGEQGGVRDYRENSL